ncbi:hypothetical protein [Sphingomonas bacterium]|uniref:hypothetical protein n=1 Tax=Sphingomonas bacterium TaxID=1895847 RepID=UPI00263250FE|nr:hypothetical protein [Sphingomonas bacterium]
MSRYVVASIVTVASLWTCAPGFALQAASASRSLVAHEQAAKVSPLSTRRSVAAT